MDVALAAEHDVGVLPSGEGEAEVVEPVREGGSALVTPSPLASVMWDRPWRPGGCFWREITYRSGPCSARQSRSSRVMVSTSPGSVLQTNGEAVRGRFWPRWPLRGTPSCIRPWSVAHLRVNALTVRRYPRMTVCDWGIPHEHCVSASHGRLEISAIDPVASMQAVNNPALADVAGAFARRLNRWSRRSAPLLPERARLSPEHA